MPAAGIDFSHAPGEPVAWQVVPTTPTLYLGKIPPIRKRRTSPARRGPTTTASIPAKFKLAQGVTVTVPVTVHNAGTNTAYLNMWIDFYGASVRRQIAAATERATR